MWILTLFLNNMPGGTDYHVELEIPDRESILVC
jgi:hypothetical protein